MSSESFTQVFYSILVIKEIQIAKNSFFLFQIRTNKTHMIMSYILVNNNCF